MRLLERVNNIIETGKDQYDRGLRMEIESVEQTILDNAEKGLKLTNLSVDGEYIDQVLEHLNHEGFIGFISNVEYTKDDMVSLFIIPRNMVYEAVQPVSLISNESKKNPFDIKVDPPFEKTRVTFDNDTLYTMQSSPKSDNERVEIYDPKGNGGTGSWETKTVEFKEKIDVYTKEPMKDKFISDEGER